MKVVEPGNPHGWSKVFKCTGSGNGGGGCGAKLEVTQDDLFPTSSRSYDGSSDDYVTFECCACKKWTDVSSIPSAVESIVRQKRTRVPGKSQESD